MKNICALLQANCVILLWSLIVFRLMYLHASTLLYLVSLNVHLAVYVVRDA